MTRIFLILILLPSVLLAQSVGDAEQTDDAERAREAVSRGEILPLSEVMHRIEAEFDGQVLEVELDWDGSLYTYEFEILTADTRLIEVEVDAATGLILEVEDDD